MHIRRGITGDMITFFPTLVELNAGPEFTPSVPKYLSLLVFVLEV